MSDVIDDGCKPIPGTVSFRHSYTVKLTGGNYWYFQDQHAPSAVINSSYVNTEQNMTISEQAIGVGKSVEHSTGKTVYIQFPVSFQSAC